MNAWGASISAVVEMAAPRYNHCGEEVLRVSATRRRDV
jgi:hypothetical protein